VIIKTAVESRVSSPKSIDGVVIEPVVPHPLPLFKLDDEAHSHGYFPHSGHNSGHWHGYSSQSGHGGVDTVSVIESETEEPFIDTVITAVPASINVTMPFSQTVATDGLFVDHVN